MARFDEIQGIANENFGKTATFQSNSREAIKLIRQIRPIANSVDRLEV